MSNLPLKKILSDPWYAALYHATGSFELVERAGFFDDGLDDKHAPESYYALDVLTTPFQKITQHLSGVGPTKPVYILVSTGAFSPLHRGHIAMMEAAYQHLENQGKHVVGGYLSPSHDSYVSQKYGGTAALSASHRIELCRQALALHPWLMVDPWEALYTPTALNFTQIIQRLKLYLAKHCVPNQELRVVYVCGSDNADFAHVFAGYGGDIICVGRSGSEERFEKLRKIFGSNHDRIHFVPETSAHHCSSSAVRRGSYDDIPSGVRKQYEEWTNLSTQPQPSQTYLIRDEGSWTVEPWSTKNSAPRLEQAYHNFTKKLSEEITQAFSKAEKPDVARTVTPRTLPLQKQQNAIQTLTAPTISLDACTPGTHNLAVSRFFSLGDGQHQALGLVARPGTPTLTAQRSSITAGTYTLLEDDIGSGFTVKKILAELPAGVDINAWTILSKLHPQTNEAILDIVDARDFLCGSRDGGLVVELPDKTLARAPYALPYVSLVSRAKIPPSQEIELSKHIWQLNIEWYTNACPNLRLRDTAVAFQNLMRYVGFSPDTLMKDICTWHFTKLTRLTTRLWKPQTTDRKLPSILSSRIVMPMKNSATNSVRLPKNLKNTSPTVSTKARSSRQY